MRSCSSGSSASGNGADAAGPLATTQIDNAVRLSWGTDNSPGPTQYPKHGSPERAAPPPRSRRVSPSALGPLATTQIDNAVRLSWGTDN